MGLRSAWRTEREGREVSECVSEREREREREREKEEAEEGVTLPITRLQHGRMSRHIRGQGLADVQTISPLSRTLHQPPRARSRFHRIQHVLGDGLQPVALRGVPHQMRV
jgi:hypothetical protein